MCYTDVITHIRTYVSNIYLKDKVRIADQVKFHLKALVDIRK